jgi:hypothetical protein
MSNHKDHRGIESRFPPKEPPPAEAPRANRCETCVHFAVAVWAKFPPTCRIARPSAGIMQGPQGAALMGMWPPTEPHYWCSEWKASIEGT